jgi:hypothetical protein
LWTPLSCLVASKTLKWAVNFSHRWSVAADTLQRIHSTSLDAERRQTRTWQEVGTEHGAWSKMKNASKLLESRRRCARHLKTKNGRIVVKITEIKKCIEPELNSNFIVLKTGNGFFERFSFLIDPSGIYCVSTANSLCLRSTVYGLRSHSEVSDHSSRLSLVTGQWCCRKTVFLESNHRLQT